MKYINKYDNFFENINWEWLDEENEPINYDKIQPYTMVKAGLNYFFTTGDFVEYQNKLVTHIYPDEIGKVNKDLLYSINDLKFIDKIDLIKILNKDIKFSNGYSDEKRYEYYFYEIYPLMNNNYKNYLNNKFDNILKEYGYE